MKPFLLGLVLATAVLQSCDHANSVNSNASSNASQVAQSGTWKVSLFIDSGNDETSDFNGYSFVFNSGGTLTATRNGSSQTGTWSVNTSSNKFNIDLGPKTATQLGELTDDWKIISASNTEIKLTDDNPASNEFLTFTKN